MISSLSPTEMLKNRKRSVLAGLLELTLEVVGGSKGQSW